MQIFFSYGHDRHGEVVRRLAEEIEARSGGAVEVWIDSHRIPRDSHWRDAITRGILDSDSVIAFLSAYSAREESVCRDELSIALVSKHGMIRTILLEKPGEAFTPPSRISEYQWGDMSDYPEVMARGEAAFSAYIAREAEAILALVNSDEIRRYDTEIRSLRRAFHMPDRDGWTRFDALIDKPLAGREWLFERIQRWEEDPNGSRVLLLCGKPGAGKSMFSAHLQMRDPAVVAAFPCDCRRSEYSTTQSVILQIAYRLALRLPDYRSWVTELLADPAYDLDGDGLYEDLILQPLARASIDGERAVMVIVVDALDEAQSDTLADFISRSADSLKRYVRFLVTARREPAVVERFSRFEHIDLDGEAEASRADLAAYYESRLGEALAGMPEKDAFIRRLIENSGGVFTYAECVTDNILKDIQSGSFTIRDYPLPAGIEALFRDTLDRSFHRLGAPCTEADYAARWRTPLAMLLASPEPMPVSTLRSLMNWRDAELKAFRRPLSALLTETDGALTLFHRSFGEWLEATDTAYAVSREDGISALAEACFEMYDGFQDEMDEYMLLYATRFLRESRDRAHRKRYREVCRDCDYADRLFDKANTLEKNNAFARAMAFYTELLAIFDGAGPEEDAGRAYKNRGRALSRIGDLHGSTNQFAEAMASYEEALAVFRELTRRYPQDPDCLRRYSAVLVRVAGIHRARNDLSRALECLEEALAIDRRLVEQYPEDPEYQDCCSVTLEQVAGIYEAQGAPARALEYYGETLAIRRELTGRYPEDPDYLRGYSVALERVAGVRVARGELERALECYQDELDISRGLTERYPEDPNCLHVYSVALVDVADIHKAQGDLDIALADYEEALVIRRELMQRYPDNLENLHDYTIGLERVAGIRVAQSDLTGALECYEEALAIIRQLVGRYPDHPRYLRDCSVSLVLIAGIHEAQSDLESALKCYGEALAISRQMNGQYPQNPQYLRDCFVSLNKIGGIRAAQGDPNRALEYYEEALAISRQLMARYPQKPQTFDDVVVALVFCWQASERQGYLDEALEIARRHPDLAMCARVLQALGEA